LHRHKPRLGSLMKIHFFGGYRATNQNVLAWCNSLETKQPNVIAIGWPYPIGSSAGDPLKCWNCSGSIAKLISVDVDECLIVGHSSGCALANDVAGKALALGAKNFRLIALDGFLPRPELLNLPGTVVWSAECNGVHSLNYKTATARASSESIRGGWLQAKPNPRRTGFVPALLDGYLVGKFSRFRSRFPGEAPGATDRRFRGAPCEKRHP
jgi:hypothetical protein